MNSTQTCHRQRRAGFTLLEVLLTLALSVVLMSLVGAVFQFYTREMDTSDLDVRQTMLASAILQMIEDDLRATIHGDPADMEPLAALLAATGGSAAESAGSAGAGASGADAGDAADDSETDELMEEEPQDLTTGVAVLQEPGLIGNQFQIQIDVSRLPRIEEYVVMLNEDSSTTLQDVPSDIKTVAYYVQPAGGGVEDKLATDRAPSASESGGLVRRMLDRSATTFAAESGNFSLINQTGDIVAPEVVGIEFSYWDGVTWQMEWSSDDFGELPLAIKIQLTMANVRADQGSSSNQEIPLRTFTHLVRLPMAKFIGEEEEEESEADLSAAGI